MYTKEKIMDSIKYVVDNSKFIKINEDKLCNVISLLNYSNCSESWLDTCKLDFDEFTQEELLMYFILCESLNFCFWDSSVKWKIEYRRNWYSGSFGLFYGLFKAIKNGFNLLNVEYLEKLTLDEFDKILMGTTSIPLLKERFEIIKNLASEVKDIKNILDVINGGNDVELLNSIVLNFSNFRDISLYKGREVYFFKRAILLVNDFILNVDYIRKNISNNDNMIGCADYKIPQVLRNLEILEYSSDLARLVDNNKEILHDSEMEIEIRANMIYSIELIREKMLTQGININSIEIDNALWLLSKDKKFKDKPYHLTKTIYY